MNRASTAGRVGKLAALSALLGLVIFAAGCDVGGFMGAMGGLGSMMISGMHP